MTETEWLSSDDPKKMLEVICAFAAEEKLRAFGCACCRRIWEKYPLEWADQVFARDKEIPGDEAELWRNPCVRTAVEIAEAYSKGQASAEELQKVHYELTAYAKLADRNYTWANWKLGDGATLAECQVSFVTFRSAEAALAASAGDIRQTISKCAEKAAWVWYVDEVHAAVKAEERVQAQMIRDLFDFPE